MVSSKNHAMYVECLRWILYKIQFVLANYHPSHLTLCRLFQIAPELAKLFPFGDGEETLDENNPGLIKHGLQVMESIDAAVGLLGDLEELVETLKTLGIVHNMANVQLDSFAVSLEVSLIV